MDTQKHPYELLVRWDQGGKVAGAHVQWRYVVKDGEKVITESLSDAEPVAMNSKDRGFPLADILEEKHVTALASVNDLTVECQGHQDEIASLKQQIATAAAEAEQAKAAHEQERDALAEQNAALRETVRKMGEAAAPAA